MFYAQPLRYIVDVPYTRGGVVYSDGECVVSGVVMDREV